MLEDLLARASEDAALWIAAALRGEAPRVGTKMGMDAPVEIKA